MQRAKRHFSSSFILRAVEDMGLAGTWSKDLLTGEQHWSVGLSQILGHPASDGPVSFDSFLRKVHPEDRRWLIEAAGNESDLLPSEKNIRILQASGLMRWVHIRGQALFSPVGEAICMLFIVVDVTDRQKSLEALTQLNRRFEALAESFRATLFTFNPDGEKLYIHNWRVLGLPSGSTFSSRAFLDGVIPEDRERVEKHWMASLADQQPTTIRHRRFSVIDGRVLDMIYFLKPLHDDDGSVREWVGLAVSVADGFERKNPDLAILGAHIRAARALLDWSIDQLASRSGVSASTIRRIEKEGMFSPRSQSVLLIKQTFEVSGVEFFRTASGAVALSLCNPLMAGP